MKTLMTTALAFVLVSALSSPVWAGGDNGGSKNTVRIRVTNNSDAVAAVIIDVDEDNPPETEEELEDAGGKLIQPGRSASFRVTTGEHTVTAVLLDEVGEELGEPDQITVDAQQSLRLEVTGTDDAIIDEL
jgi:hypothetical protein